MGVSSFQTLDSVPNCDDRLSSLTNSYSSPSPLNSLQSSSDQSSENSVKLSPKLSNYSTSLSTGCLTNGITTSSKYKSTNRESIYARPTVSPPPPPPPIKLSSTTYTAAQFARQQILRHYASSPCASPSQSLHQNPSENVYEQPNSYNRLNPKLNDDETSLNAAASEAKSDSVKSMTSTAANVGSSTINDSAGAAYASSTLKRVIRRPAGK